MDHEQTEAIVPPTPAGRWLNRTVAGIVLATFLSDVGHELATAVLPLYLASIGLGAAALGLIEGLADLLVSLSKLAGGWFGHHVSHKRPWTALGYLVTAMGVSAMGLVRSAGGLAACRTVAWAGRGFRSPLRDYLLSDAVKSTHYGRAYGLERAGDMLGAMLGPLIAALAIWGGMPARTLLLYAFIPGTLAAAAVYFLVRERADVEPVPAVEPPPPSQSQRATPPLPRAYWWFLGGVCLFGLGDFSRTFLIYLAAKIVGEQTTPAAGALSIPILIYLAHNLGSAVVAYPIGHWGDRGSKFNILIGGYALGVAANVVLAFGSTSMLWLCVAVAMSALYIATEDTLEKAVTAEYLPREIRSWGFGVLASANAAGDMISSLFVGVMLERGLPHYAFGAAAAAGFAGVAWLVFARSTRLLNG
jgi:MFS family permease